MKPLPFEITGPYGRRRRRMRRWRLLLLALAALLLWGLVTST